MSLYHIALGVLYGVLGVLMVASIVSAMLSSHISREEERPFDSHSHPDKRK